MLHSNIAFPLLEELAGIGDPLAKRVFKDEVVKRLTSDHMPIVIYLLKHGYLDMFMQEEFDILMLEIRRKPYIFDKRLLNYFFISDDFDEVPPIDRFSIETIIFSTFHPRLNLFELIIRFGHLYYESFNSWIIRLLDRLAKEKPKFFRKKIDLFIKEGYLHLPVKKESDIKYSNRFDYSKMNTFSIVLYNKFLRHMNLKKY